MTGTPARPHRPQPEAYTVYEPLFSLYRNLHDAFGTPAGPASLNHMMKHLIAIREAAR